MAKLDREEFIARIERLLLAMRQERQSARQEPEGLNSVLRVEAMEEQLRIFQEREGTTLEVDDHILDLIETCESQLPEPPDD